MVSKKDFHTFFKKEQCYLFLTKPVALFRIDRETHEILKKVEAGEDLHSPFEKDRYAEAQVFMDNYCRKSLPSMVLRSPEDITEKVIGLYLFVAQECNLKCVPR